MSDNGDDVAALRAENQRLRQYIATLEAQGREQEARLAQNERENSNLASLYVAAHQIHATLDPREVLSTLVEILANFVGAKTFAIYLYDDDGALRAVAAENVARDALPPQPPVGLIGEVAATGQPYYPNGITDGADPLAEPPLVAVPLRLRDHVAGVIAIWAFFVQKGALADVDFEIFNLLGAHAASALEAARLAAEARAGGTPTELRFAGLAGHI